MNLDTEVVITAMDHRGFRVEIHFVINMYSVYLQKVAIYSNEIVVMGSSFQLQRKHHLPNLSLVLGTTSGVVR